VKARNTIEQGRKDLAERRKAQRAVAVAASDAIFDSMDERAAQQFFGRRGFSAKTVMTLVGAGIKFPEELLSKNEQQIDTIFGRDENGLAEIHAYRTKFLG